MSDNEDTFDANGPRKDFNRTGEITGGDKMAGVSAKDRWVGAPPARLVCAICSVGVLWRELLSAQYVCCDSANPISPLIQLNPRPQPCMSP